MLLFWLNGFSIIVVQAMTMRFPGICMDVAWSSHGQGLETHLSYKPLTYKLKKKGPLTEALILVHYMDIKVIPWVRSGIPLCG